MADIYRCARCGMSGPSVLDYDLGPGGAAHPSQSNCIQALKEALASAQNEIAQLVDVSNWHCDERNIAMARAKKAESIVDAIKTELENDFDIEDGAEGPRPNAAMRYRDAIEAIERQKGDA